MLCDVALGRLCVVCHEKFSTANLHKIDAHCRFSSLAYENSFIALLKLNVYTIVLSAARSIVLCIVKWKKKFILAPAPKPKISSKNSKGIRSIVLSVNSNAKAQYSPVYNSTKLSIWWVYRTQGILWVIRMQATSNRYCRRCVAAGACFTKQ